MTDLEKYHDQVIGQELISFETPPEPEGPSISNLIAGILHHWLLVLVTFVVICAIGIPAVWFLIEPQYLATAPIRVAPIIPNVLFSDKDSERVMPLYDNFKSDQARLITADQGILITVADNLASKGLKIFENKSPLPEKIVGLVKTLPQAISKKIITTISPEKPADPVEALRQAISRGIITASPVRGSEMIFINVISAEPKEAEQIATAFRLAYMYLEGNKSTTQGGVRMQLLEKERDEYATILKDQRDTIRGLAQEYGTVELTPRQEMMLQRVAVLQGLATKIDADKILLEIKIELFEKTKDRKTLQKALLERRHTFVQNDILIRMLTERIAQLEEELISAGQVLSDDNPKLKQRAELLEVFKAKLEENREKVEKTFDESITEELSENREAELADAKLELQGLIAQREILQAKIDKEDINTIELGRKQLDIGELQERMALTKEVYDTILRRIQQMEMERKRPARISVPYETTVVPVPSKRIKYTIALMFGGMACGMLLAFLKDKADLRLHTLNDVTKCIGIRIIGTTTSSHTVKPALLPEQIAEDFQTIRTNLGLLDGEGIPNKLVVTSPGMQEGKTTFAINLATSLSRSGKKVLLIDGDLRKPDIARLLNLPKVSKGLQDVLLGKEFDQVVYSIPSTGLDVLASDSHGGMDAYELIASPIAHRRINELSEEYDHVIIDTPPVLVCADALIWAKFGDAVILTSFAGKTTTPELRKAKERLTQIDARVLGTVLSNVQVEESYSHRGYGYYTQNAQSRKNVKRARRKLLDLVQDIEVNANDSRASE
ncbi:MAG: polysaccharide biosynthesis tyrosine autokinase [Planctomycetota bacterium]